MQKHARSKAMVEKLLEGTELSIDGKNPWDIQVHDNRFFERCLKDGVLGFGESYMQGWWHCEQLDVLCSKLMSADLESKLKANWRQLLHYLWRDIFNYQSTRKAWEIGEKHYDIDNELYQRMLDPTMSYSCGYWQNASHLNDAQIHKLDLICRKLMLKPGQCVLDIGCGWGGLAKYMVEKYDVKVTGVTVSKRQIELAEERCRGLPVTFLLQDYRSIAGTFDRIVSVGMFEHVGAKNHKTFFSVAKKKLKREGLLLLHTIGQQVTNRTNRWIDKYIFTNSLIPSVSQVCSSFNKLFYLEDWHNFGADYNKTLQCWHENFLEAWPDLKHRYDERFFRMWKFYLMSSAASFQICDKSLWQIVLSHDGVNAGYLAAR